MIAAALLLATQAAPGGPVPPLPAPDAQIEWTVALDDPDGRVYFDPASVRRDGALVRFNARGVPTDPASAPVLIVREVIDCANDTTGPEEVAAYDPAGRLLVTQAIPAAEMQMRPIRPNGPEAFIRQRYCPAAEGAAE